MLKQSIIMVCALSTMFYAARSALDEGIDCFHACIVVGRNWIAQVTNFKGP
jgi:hypothetical protein